MFGSNIPDVPESGLCWCVRPAGPLGLCERHEYERLEPFGVRLRAHILDAMFGVKSQFTIPGPEIGGDGADGVV
jgi:hypothetical protein